VKFNALGVVMRNYSFQYERMLTRKISANLGFRFMPKGKVPLLSAIESLINDELFDDLNSITVGNTAITPEIRFYFGKKDGAIGFYFAPYVRFANYQITYPNFEYEVYDESGAYLENKTIFLDGKANTTTAGFSIGTQWRIGKWVYLDWTILGPNYGGIDGILSGSQSLNIYEQKGLREALEDIDVPFAETSATADTNGGQLKLTGPWAGIRTSLGIGIKF